MGAADYAVEVLADSPVGFWLLDETSGTTATDSSGNANHGTYIGSPALAADLIGDFVCPTFDGTDDFVDLPAIAVGVSPYTLEGIARPDVLKYDVWILGENYNSNFVTAAMGTQTGGLGTAGQIVAGGYYGGGSWAAVLDGTWVVGNVHHVAYTYDGTTGRLYVDGVAAGTVTTAGGSSGDHWGIGCDTFRGGFWDGAIAGVALYPTALSAARIADHNDAFTGAPEEGAVSFTASATFGATAEPDPELGAVAFGASATFGATAEVNVEVAAISFTAAATFGATAAPGVRLGTDIVEAVYVGADVVTVAYLGTELIWSAGA